MKTYADLLSLATSPSSSTLFEPPAPSDSSPSFSNIDQAISQLLEADDDPHRLANINLDRYRIHTDGGTIRYWRGEWYTWKPSRGCYRRIEEDELRSKITQSIKTEFDRISQEKVNAGNDDPNAQKVTKALVTNVMEATKSLTLIPSSTEINSWVSPDCRTRARKNFIAFTNGILDLDRLLQNNDDDSLDDILLPPSPEWFSTVRLPYEFDPNTSCPKLNKFLERSLELDPERIKLLQEWAGYLLLPDTSQQKFLALEGEGSNGKSVYFAAITAMLGLDNCSYVSVEQLSDKFVRTQTLGRLANICPDTPEKNDKVNEGDLKSFTSGDVMFFDRKYLSGLNCIPTARLMISFNNRPRWADKSSGIWRRMILIPFRVNIEDHEKVLGMDKYTWWHESGEISGILNWAIAGLHRLRQQKRFTRSTLSEEAIEDYKNEANPARSFLLENMEECDAEENLPVRTALIYRVYKKWAEENGYRPLGEKTFGKEIKRAFPKCNRLKRGPRGSQHWFYLGIQFTENEICDIKTQDELF